MYEFALRKLIYTLASNVGKKLHQPTDNCQSDPIYKIFLDMIEEGKC